MQTNNSKSHQPICCVFLAQCWKPFLSVCLRELKGKTVKIRIIFCKSKSNSNRISKYLWIAKNRKQAIKAASNKLAKLIRSASASPSHVSRLANMPRLLRSQSALFTRVLPFPCAGFGGSFHTVLQLRRARGALVRSRPWSRASWGYDWKRNITSKKRGRAAVILIKGVTSSRLWSQKN